MAVLSRKPTAREKAHCLQAQDKGLSTVEDLIYALINTRQFIFNRLTFSSVHDTTDGSKLRVSSTAATHRPDNRPRDRSP